tara:strand:+ start:88 stop:417 length:330 start_codon:yes stop_codon:yes gene_type:complete
MPMGKGTYGKKVGRPPKKKRKANVKKATKKATTSNTSGYGPKPKVDDKKVWKGWSDAQTSVPGKARYYKRSQEMNRKISAAGRKISSVFKSLNRKPKRHTPVDINRPSY